MPIVVSQISDPTSTSWDEQATGLAESGPGQVLARSLTRYLRGEISGRSVLIAGHRGAGKSTLVDLALRKVATPGSRPLRISLHGPSLLPRPRSDGAAGSDGKEDAGAKTKGKDRKTAQKGGQNEEPSDAQRLLMELTVALYRGLAREVIESFDRTIGMIDAHRLPRRHTELAGQLVLELDEAPSPDRLRRFWVAVDRMDRGLLFPASAPRRPDQGARELVALASAAQAFRVVAGKIDHAEERSREAELSASSTRNSTLDTKAILGALLGLLSGLFGATAALLLGKAAEDATGMSGLTLIGAAASAILAAISAKRTAKITVGRKIKDKHSYKFIRDYKVDTLSRELPVLIDRIRQAGLSPVFVVDELDKIPSLHTKLHELIQELKPLVAERTFFCFVTDRNYYEYLRLKDQDAPYAVEHTYFTDRLYVSYQPTSLRAFLGRVITVEPTEQESRETLEVERRALTYVMLYRARFHPFDLNRQVQNFAAASEGRRTLEGGAIRTDLGSLHALTYQLAVEAILRQEELTTRIAQDAYFGQLAYDALYYPADVWQKGQTSLELDRDALRRHLAKRMVPIDPGGRSADEPTDETPGAPSPALIDRLVEASALSFLLDRVEELVDQLATPRTLLKTLEWLGVDTEVANLVPSEPLLVRNGTTIRFSYDAFGRPLEGLDATRRTDFQRVGPELRAVDRSLKAATGNTGAAFGLDALAVDFSVLKLTPAWQPVALSLERFERANFEVAPGDPANEALAVIRYSAMFQDRRRAFTLSLACAQKLADLTGAPLRACLLALKSLGELASKSTEGVEAALQAAARVLGVDAAALIATDLQEFLDRILCRSADDAQVGFSELSEIRSELWSRVFARVRNSTESVKGLWRLDRSDLICAAAGHAPIRLLRTDLDAMTIAEWTTILRLSCQPSSPGNSNYVPRWMAMVAAERLGLRRAGFAISHMDGEVTEDASRASELEWLVRDIPAGAAPQHLVFVLADDMSAAMGWRPGQSVVGVVTTKEDLQGTMDAMGQLVDASNPPKPKMKRSILSELGLNNELRRNPVFEKATFRFLTWSPNDATPATSEAPVVGADDIDDLKLSARSHRRPDDPATVT